MKKQKIFILNLVLALPLFASDGDASPYTITECPTAPTHWFGSTEAAKLAIAEGGLPRKLTHPTERPDVAFPGYVLHEFRATPGDNCIAVSVIGGMFKCRSVTLPTEPASGALTALCARNPALVCLPSPGIIPNIDLSNKAFDDAVGSIRIPYVPGGLVFRNTHLALNSVWGYVSTYGMRDLPAVPGARLHSPSNIELITFDALPVEDLECKRLRVFGTVNFSEAGLGIGGTEGISPAGSLFRSGLVAIGSRPVIRILVNSPAS